MISLTHPSTLHESLVQSGFAAIPGGYQRESIRVQLSSRWLCFAVTGGHDVDLGGVGLWKTVFDQSDAHRVFSVPIDLCWQEDEPDERIRLLRACIDWATCSAEAKIPSGWEPPALAAIHAVISPNRFIIQKGTIVRQIELIATPERLALRVPLASLPRNLPENRFAWLKSVLRDAQSQWHLLRLGIADDPGGSIVRAEVDLTGAPDVFALPLLLAARDCLWWAVTNLAETADFLADAAMASQALLSCCAIATTENEPKETVHENY